MTTLLHLDASVRTGRSLSRRLSQAFVDAWHAHRPADPVIRRDVGQNPPPFISESWIAAAFTPPDQRSPEAAAQLALSDGMISELEQADVIVLGTPMYNYGMPAPLKAWFDQVIRVNKTFSFDLARGDFPLEPSMGGKTLVILSSCGEFGFSEGGARAQWNHLDTHIRTCARYLGVAETHHVAIEYQEFGDDRHARSVAAAHAEAARLAADLARHMHAEAAWMPAQSQVQDRREILALIERQFASVSWREGGAADWDTFAAGFVEGAPLYPSARPVAPQTLAAFEQRMRGLQHAGRLRSFSEALAQAEIHVAGRVAVALARCEMLENGTDRNGDTNAILLIKDDAGWRIAAQAWDAST